MDIPTGPLAYGTMYYVDRMDEAIRFYKGLGLTPQYESDEWTEFSFNGHSLCLHPKRAGESYRENGILIISANGIRALFERMKSNGLDVYNLHEVHSQAWTFHMKDPSQNEVSFFGAP